MVQMPTLGRRVLKVVGSSRRAEGLECGQVRRNLEFLGFGRFGSGLRMRAACGVGSGRSKLVDLAISVSPMIFF